jgi:outer membrane protein, multidrug efflux system
MMFASRSVVWNKLARSPNKPGRSCCHKSVTKGDISLGRNEFLGNPNPAGPAGAHTSDSVFGALSASWEIDLWGRIRRLNESARASFLATEEAQRGVRISLIAQLAQAYFELLELERRLEIATRTTGSFKESARIFNQRYEAGGASKLDTSRAEAALASTAANVPEIERQIAPGNSCRIAQRVAGTSPGYSAG